MALEELGNTEPLNTYTFSDVHNAMNAALNSNITVAEKVSEMRKDLTEQIAGIGNQVTGMRSDIREITAVQRRCDQELWDTEGESKIAGIRNELEIHKREIWTEKGISRIDTAVNGVKQHDLQIKGVWAVLGVVVMALVGWFTNHWK